MRPIGFGLILLMVAFALGAYALFVPWTIVQRAQARGGMDLNALSDFLNSLYNALQIGLLAMILAIIGTLVFFVEFSVRTPSPHELKYAPVHPVQPPLPNRYCTFCGTELSENDIFCRKCGKVAPSK